MLADKRFIISWQKLRSKIARCMKKKKSKLRKNLNLNYPWRKNVQVVNNYMIRWRDQQDLRKVWFSPANLIFRARLLYNSLCLNITMCVRWFPNKSDLIFTNTGMWPIFMILSLKDLWFFTFWPQRSLVINEELEIFQNYL